MSWAPNSASKILIYFGGLATEVFLEGGRPSKLIVGKRV